MARLTALFLLAAIACVAASAANEHAVTEVKPGRFCSKALGSKVTITVRDKTFDVEGKRVNQNTGACHNVGYTLGAHTQGNEEEDADEINEHSNVLLDTKTLEKCFGDNAPIAQEIEAYVVPGGNELHATFPVFGTFKATRC